MFGLSHTPYATEARRYYLFTSLACSDGHPQQTQDPHNDHRNPRCTQTAAHIHSTYIFTHVDAISARPAANIIPRGVRPIRTATCDGFAIGADLWRTRACARLPVVACRVAHPKAIRSVDDPEPIILGAKARLLISFKNPFVGRIRRGSIASGAVAILSSKSCAPIVQKELPILPGTPPT